MQEYKDIDIDSLISDGPDTINKNFKTLMSNNAGGEFPTDNLYAGMTCYRSDEGKIYTLKNDLSTWVELFDISSASGAVAPLAGALTKTLSIANGGTGATTVEDARKNLGIEDVVTYDVLPISQGGTGANNASQACANLGAVRKVNNTAPDSNGNVNVANVNVDNMAGASDSAAGKAGLVPAPAAGKQTSFLRGDGTWVVPTNTTYSAGTGISLSGTTFSNSGVRSVVAGSSANQLAVNTNGTTATITINNVANATAASSATKATQDSAGQQINTTYIKGLSVSGKTITYTKGDGSTGTITTQDTNTNTTNTAGSTDTSSKIFLIGATSQATAPVTYSHDTAYVGTDGCLYSNNTKVSVEGHTHSYVPISDVANSANKIPRYNSSGHLVLPDGSEFWIA